MNSCRLSWPAPLESLYRPIYCKGGGKVRGEEYRTQQAKLGFGRTKVNHTVGKNEEAGCYQAHFIYLFL